MRTVLVSVLLCGVAVALPTTQIVVRPNTIVDTRVHAFRASLPHLAGGNCHVSVIRPLSDCPDGCTDRGLCDAGMPGDNPGECWCMDGWKGKACTQRVNLHADLNVTASGGHRGSSSAFRHPRVKMCYYQANAANFFDMTTFEQPEPILANQVRLEQVTVTQRLNATRAAVMLLEEDEDAPAPPSEDVIDNEDENTPPTQLAATEQNPLTKAIAEGALKANEALNKLANIGSPPPPPPPEEETAPPPPPPEEETEEESVSPSPSPSPSVFVDLEVDVIDAYGDVGILVAENRISWTEKEGIVGYTLQPPSSFFPGFDTVVEISGKLYCHDHMEHVKNAFLAKRPSRDAASDSGALQWMLVHSTDGSNMNYRTLAQGEAEIINGTFAGHGANEGLTVYGIAPSYTPAGYIALWLNFRFTGEKNPFSRRPRRGLVYDDLKWTFTKGSASGVASAPKAAKSESDCSDCISDPADEHVINLPMGRV